VEGETSGVMGEPEMGVGVVGVGLEDADALEGRWYRCGPWTLCIRLHVDGLCEGTCPRRCRIVWVMAEYAGHQERFMSLRGCEEGRVEREEGRGDSVGGVCTKSRTLA
jgi:hypothetical protein